MPQALTEDATNADHGTGLQVPSNGDDSIDWAPVLVAGSQQLADRTQALFQGSMVGDGTANKTIGVRLDAMHNQDDRFAFTESSNHEFYQQADVTSAGFLVFPLESLPTGATIVAVHARIQGNGHSSLPATKPKLTVYEVTDLTDTELATATDAPADVAAYEAFHTLSVTVNAPVQALKTYHAKFEGETGANSQTGLNLAGLFIELGVS